MATISISSSYHFITTSTFDILGMLPLALLLLIQANVLNAQQVLPLDKLSTFTPRSLSNPPIFALPSAHTNLSISVALCASSSSQLQFFVSNDTSITQPGPGDVGNGRVFEIELEDGLGAWSGIVNDGGFLAVSGAVQVPIEIGVSQNGECHPLEQYMDQT